MRPGKGLNTFCIVCDRLALKAITGIIGFFSNHSANKLNIFFMHFSLLEICLFGSISRTIVRKRLEKRGETTARFTKF